MTLAIDSFDDAYGEDGFDRRPVRKSKPVKRKSKAAFFATLILGTTLLGGVWVGAAVLSVGKMAAPGGLAPQPKFQTVLSMRITQPAAPAAIQTGAADTQRIVPVSKFSRIPTTADVKNSRLAGAEAAALAALRPAADAVRNRLDMALAASTRKAEQSAQDQQFAALMASRPDAGAIRNALVPAMENIVAVAPRGVMPDLMQDVTPATNVAELESIKPVEVAPVAVASAEPVKPAASTEVALADTLPKSGPMPFGRPAAAATAAVAQPPRGGLDAIARVSPQKPSRDEKPDTVLAYAKPDNPLREREDAPGKIVPSPKFGNRTAVYDITNAVVHMPDGTKLEAHSGIGKMRDNPDYTHVKMKGPTPAGTYKVTLRESLFHGVAAVRLTPTDGKAPHGRVGLLAHSYLLRTRGDSHGCVAFANYDKFLAAFKRGEVDTMVIVEKWDGKRPGRGTSSGKTLVDLFSRNNGA